MPTRKWTSMLFCLFGRPSRLTHWKCSSTGRPRTPIISAHGMAFAAHNTQEESWPSTSRPRRQGWPSTVVAIEMWNTEQD
uniref:Uncharacterized protein n=1 Tax=Picea sitchensis TaxID=3332 RepID=A9NQZ1_PICSI|nr:unknown [Picea sitchensis]